MNGRDDLRDGVRYDLVVVGLGGLGSATAWQAARRGLRVLGLERFELGHVRGASHGDSRIVRLSYHSPAYVENAKEAYADWAELAAETGVEHVVRTGGIDVFPVGAAIGIDDYVEAMTATGVPFQTLDAAASQRRFPTVAVPDGATVLFQERSGYVDPGRATAALQAQARAHGAVLRDRAHVVTLTESGGQVQVRLAGGEMFTAGAAVVTADAWTNDVLAGLDVHVPLTVTKEQVQHFAVADAATHAPGAMPVWIWMDDPSFYGFPTVGEASIKLGQDCGGRPVDPDTRTFDPDPEYARRTAQFVREVLPGAGEVVRTTTCLYTLTPDRDFVVDVVPGHERVAVGLGAAHGFKFAPWFGRVLTDLATTGTTTSDVAGLGLSRPALTAADGTVSWLV